jgi:hypothetical protein
LVKNAVAGIARNYVKMQVFDNLAGGSAVIAQQIIAVGFHSSEHGLGDFAYPGTDLA